jgi:hypothetical protein
MAAIRLRGDDFHPLNVAFFGAAKHGVINLLAMAIYDLGVIH